MTTFTCLVYMVHVKLSFLIRKYDIIMFLTWIIISFGLYMAYIIVTDDWVSWDVAHFTFKELYTTPLFYLVFIFCTLTSYLYGYVSWVWTELLIEDPRDALRRKVLSDYPDFEKKF